ncbi:MAG: IS1182 family transposase, partial [Anaerolineales bacterium]
MNKHHRKITFKPYQQSQPMLLPPSLEELIPEGHLVRVINEFVESIDLSVLEATYKGGGTSSYHPKMLLKVLVYGYVKKIYSSRQMAAALRENINFMWLSGGNRPDFRTINRFRGERLTEIIQEVFAQLVLYLASQDYIKLTHYFTDGTKLEANANKYSYVWRKSTTRYQKAVMEKVKELFKEIDQINEEEDQEYCDDDLDELGEGKEINSEEIEALAKKLSEKLKKKPQDKKAKSAFKKLTKEYIPRLRKYENYQETLGKRNSFSKTDKDATFMRMKGDSMRMPILKPGYNVQIGTENQFIVGFSVHQNASDTVGLIDHLEQVEKNLGMIPGKIIADAGYGCEENYVYLENNDLEAFVKYPGFDREQGKGKRRKPSARSKYYASNFTYDETTGDPICPEGNRLSYQETIEDTTHTGYTMMKRLYRCEQGTNCPVRDLCTKALNWKRSHEYSPRLMAYKKQVSGKLTSDEGRDLRSRRLIEPEAVFGLIKQNMNFRRFNLRGLKKVSAEWGLISIAHNMIKMAA